jgi:hypothetical protein
VSRAVTPAPPWPATSQQRLLLEAALLIDDDAGLESWRRWKHEGGFDRVDRESFRLLPLVHRRHRDMGHDDDASGVLAGITKRAWVANRLLLDRSVRALDCLLRSGVTSAVLKGAALASVAYPDLACRPMHDLDLLVPQGQVDEALGALRADGWRPRQPEPALGDASSIPLSFQRFRHAIGLVHDDGGAVDLHWHLAPATCWDGAERTVWSRTVPFDLDGRPVRTLDPTDHLLHAVLHGTVWSPVPEVRWLADVPFIVRSGGVDWDALPTRVADLRIAPPIRGGLRALSGFDVAVPERIDRRVRELSVGDRLDERWFAHRASPRGDHLDGSGIVAEIGRYRRSMHGRRATEVVAGVPSFLQHWWSLDRPSQVPRAVVARMARSLRLGHLGRPS